MGLRDAVGLEIMAGVGEQEGRKSNSKSHYFLSSLHQLTLHSDMALRGERNIVYS
jgi:hypothetical protein